MAYATTALIDAGVVAPDVSLEAAAAKVRGSEAMFVAINDCIQVRGGGMAAAYVSTRRGQ